MTPRGKLRNNARPMNTFEGPSIEDSAHPEAQEAVDGLPNTKQARRIAEDVPTADASRKSVLRFVEGLGDNE